MAAHQGLLSRQRLCGATQTLDEALEGSGDIGIEFREEGIVNRLLLSEGFLCTDIDNRDSTSLSHRDVSLISLCL